MVSGQKTGCQTSDDDRLLEISSQGQLLESAVSQAQLTEVSCQSQLLDERSGM